MLPFRWLFWSAGFFVTVLPPNPLGDAAENSLREFGVDTGFIRRDGNRIGTYFIEYGASIRATQVVYDRAGSAIAGLQPGTFDWEAILSGKTWLHVTGITPALSESCAAECRTAMETARRLGAGKLRSQLPPHPVEPGKSRKRHYRTAAFRKRTVCQRGCRRRCIRHPDRQSSHLGGAPGGRPQCRKGVGGAGKL